MFILAATNWPWDLDEAILRRLSKWIYIPLPDETARKKIFEIKFKDIPIEENIDWDEIVKRTNMYNSDDITNVCWDASLIPFSDKMNDIMD